MEIQPLGLMISLSRNNSFKILLTMTRSMTITLEAILTSIFTRRCLRTKLELMLIGTLLKETSTISRTRLCSISVLVLVS